MSKFKCPYLVSRSRKDSSTNLAVKQLLSFMSCCFMSSCKTSATNVTLEILNSLMNCCHMYIKVSLSCKASITNVALERFLSFINRYYMTIQNCLLCRSWMLYSLLSHVHSSLSLMYHGKICTSWVVNRLSSVCTNLLTTNCTKGGSDLVWYSIDRDIFKTESIFL